MAAECNRPGDDERQEFDDCVCLLLSNGYYALVDAGDFEALARWRWDCQNGYARRTLNRRRCEGATSIKMHRWLLGSPAGRDTDHINGNRLDNRRKNLRLCSEAESARNVRKWAKPTSSMYKGVRRYQGAWQAAIRMGGRKIRYLGRFQSEWAAAEAYNDAATEAFGEFARLNVQGVRDIHRDTHQVPLPAVTNLIAQGVAVPNGPP